MTNLQDVMQEYARKAMVTLYGVSILTYFDDVSGLRAIFRHKNIPPYSHKGLKDWQKKRLCSITFNNKLYSQKFLAPHAWNTIVHEITHFEIGVTGWNAKHSKKFREAFQRNLKKVDILRKQFNKEIGTITS